MDYTGAIEGEIVSESIVPQMDMALSVSRAPRIVLEEARQAAKALAEVIESKPKKVTFNGRTYLTYEDWQTVARFYGVTAKVASTQFVEYGEVKGFEARAVSLLLSNGMEISAADAMCLNDEQNWGTKPLFQLRSMAQTRACAKALRNVLAFVPVLAGYEPTPAEEIDGIVHETRTEQVSQPATRESRVSAVSAQESITISPWENGNVALSGHGLTILAANKQGGLASFATWLPDAHLWTIPEEFISALEGLARFHSVTLTRQNFPSENYQEPKVEHVAEHDSPIISAVSRKTGTRGEFLSVRWGESFYSCFDEKLFTYLEKAKGMSAVLRVSAKNTKGYQHVVGIECIGNQKFNNNAPSIS